MEQQLNAAVIGCGRMGAFTSESVIRHAPRCWLPLSHAEAICSHPRLRLAALCDTDAAMLQRAGDKYQVAHRYEDPRKLLDAERPALLGLATRTVGRAELIEHAIAAGIRAIHAEKPLCNSVTELQRLREAFRRDEVFVTWGAIRRFFGVYRQALALAETGRYGALREIRVNFGSAPLFWTHPHSIDLLLFGAAGRRVVGVQARLADVTTEGRATAVDSDPRVVSAGVYFDDGLAGHITQALGADFILSCADAEIAVRADGARLEVYAAGEAVYPTARELAIEDSEAPGGTLGPVSQLVACLDGDAGAIAANAAVKRDILDAQSIAFAMLQSHLEGSRGVEPSALDPAIVIMARTGGRYA